MVVAYVAALVLLLTATSAVIAAVAWSRARGHADAVQAEAVHFALSRQGILTATLVSASVFASVALAAARWDTAAVLDRLRLRRSRARPAGVAAGIAGTIGLSLFSGTASELLGVRGQGALENIAHALAAPTHTQLAAAIVAVAVAPGIAEEMFFRGLVQTRLVARWRRWPAILATSAAFGFVHLDPVQGSLALVLGVYLGWIAERFGSVRPAIAAHACNNAVFVGAASVGSVDHPPTTTALTMTAAGLLLWAGSTAFARSRAAVRPPEASTSE